MLPGGEKMGRPVPQVIGWGEKEKESDAKGKEDQKQNI